MNIVISKHALNALFKRRDLLTDTLEVLSYYQNHTVSGLKVEMEKDLRAVNERIEVITNE